MTTAPTRIRPAKYQPLVHSEPEQMSTSAPAAFMYAHRPPIAAPTAATRTSSAPLALRTGYLYPVSPFATPSAAATPRQACPILGLMSEAAFVALLIVFPLIGVTTRRWAAILLPAVGWPLFYIGLNQRWWGNGTGDGWQYAALLVSALGVVITGLAVTAARAWRRPALPQ